MGRNIMVIGSFYTPCTLLLVCLVVVTSSRGIGTRVSPPVTKTAITTNNKEVEDLMYSWIIPRLISMKYAQPYKQVVESMPEESDGEEAMVGDTWYTHPNLRGKRTTSFFPFPASFMEKVQEVVLPWEMKYFSPMLRG